MSDMQLVPITTNAKTKETSASKTAKLVKMMDTIIDAVEAGGAQGAPSGVMYAALSPYMSLDIYQRLMNSMVHMELLSVSGHLYHLTDKGAEWHKARCL
jgi:hypothetical protein